MQCLYVAGNLTECPLRRCPFVETRLFFGSHVFICVIKRGDLIAVLLLSFSFQSCFVL